MVARMVRDHEAVGSTPAAPTMSPQAFGLRRFLRYFTSQEKSAAGSVRRGKMKIHIIGGPGSGKTYLADKLSAKYGIRHYDLDDLQWDNSSDAYGTKRDPRQRDELLDAILSNDDWIIEGVYYAWCKRCFADADKIYLLSAPRYKYRYRIIRRFIRRKLGFEKGKRETVASLRALLSWADKYQRESILEIRKELAQYPDKVTEGHCF